MGVDLSYQTRITLTTEPPDFESEAEKILACTAAPIRQRISEAEKLLRSPLEKILDTHCYPLPIRYEASSAIFLSALQLPVKR